MRANCEMHLTSGVCSHSSSNGSSRRPWWPQGDRVVSPAYLLNCLPPEGGAELPPIEERSDESVQAWAYEAITEKQLATARAARLDECDLRRQYLTTAFTDLILGLQDELNDLQ